MIYFFIILIFAFFKMVASEHIHTKNHELKMNRIYNLWKKLDKEIEKLEAGYTYNFDSILKAMIYVSKKMECLACQKTYQGAIFYNKNIIIPNLEKQLQSGKLPKLATED